MEPPKISLTDNRVVCAGDWTAQTVPRVAKELAKLRLGAESYQVDFSDLGALDSAGAWSLRRALRKWQEQGANCETIGLVDEHERLLDLVEEHAISHTEIPAPQYPGFLENIGRDAHEAISSYLVFLTFIGRLTLSSLRIAFTPAKLRWSSVISHIQSAGFDALPIIGLLTFLLGLVIAYQGGSVLEDYGAGIYTADLVGLSMVRELSPLITAIIVAGRTGSAYTAEIATMKVTEEIDALRTMGISPVEELALPKFFALVISLPLLTVFGDIMGMLGGMVMVHSMFDVSFKLFVDRITYTVTTESFLIGVGKAPVFAMMIAAVGCYQGFQVKASAEQVGRQTTISVVQSIFLVIVVDAIFSIIFSKLGI
ncbi:MAG: MlaE family lipid ABC transporter permease subunit [Gammaproteobacteria bacterium]|nr:MlaE family lipid ABC transporter permease subunit [Gammaproteobacteria bacterium]